MKSILLCILFIGSVFPALARHITGGEVLYDYVGPGLTSGTKVYKITVRLFRDNLGGGAAMPPAIRIGVFDNGNNTQYGGFRDILLTSTEPVGIVSSPTCLTNAPQFDYTLGLYVFDITLPDNTEGYTITYQTCCRVQNITNLGNGSQVMVGAAYTGEIPGTNALSGMGNDNSARFQTGISIICKDKRFTLDFSSTDPDGDQLVYSFANAYDGGTITDAGLNNNPAPPPYGSVSYLPGFSSNPLGPLATINPATGIISGIAPGAGKYVVCVVVRSFRNGVFIASHRKDFIVTVAPCDFASADLPKTITSCDVNGITITFSNQSNSALNLTYYWDFGDPASGTANTSTLENPTHTYSSPGMDYILTLIVNRNTPCADSATAVVKVYPGFMPAFAPLPPQCKNTPIQFNDATTATYGFVNYWRWDFGDQSSDGDTSLLSNPIYSYSSAGTYNATFIVGTNKGCRDTLYPTVTIVDKPDLKITNDTLICSVDTIQLRSNFTSGNISWSPNYMINNVNSFNPLVSPDITTTYTATYSDSYGCSVSKTVKIEVVNSVTLLNINDTTICRTDSVLLKLNTDALYFNWSPANLILNPSVKDPIVFPVDPLTTFHVIASISNKCFTEKTVRVKTVPYPAVAVAGDTAICFGKNAQLNASGGSKYTWAPPIYLSNINIKNPVVIKPQETTTYNVTVRDTLGCPKPINKSITVKVIKLTADAGPSDTSVVLNQPLQLNATGGETYVWTPPTYLNNPAISSPISLPKNNITYTVTVSNSLGCAAKDTINVKVFFLPPDLYVPSAFTPGGDRLNDIFRPIALGIRSLEEFSIYNRWGELVYITDKIGAGWDGKFKGEPQSTGTFVWQVKATDYKGKKILRKGTVILIK